MELQSQFITIRLSVNRPPVNGSIKLYFPSGVRVTNYVKYSKSNWPATWLVGWTSASIFLNWQCNKLSLTHEGNSSYGQALTFDFVRYCQSMPLHLFVKTCAFLKTLPKVCPYCTFIYLYLWTGWLINFLNNQIMTWDINLYSWPHFDFGKLSTKPVKFGKD